MIATIRLLDEHLMFSFYQCQNEAQYIEMAKDFLAKGHYRIHVNMVTEGFEGDRAAEEMFDLTNNPDRQREREERYGTERSISVGDIISHGGIKYLCASRGWIPIHYALSC